MTRAGLKLVTYYNKSRATFCASRHTISFHLCKTITLMVQCRSRLLCTISGLLFAWTKQCNCRKCWNWVLWNGIFFNLMNERPVTMFTSFILRRVFSHSSTMTLWQSSSVQEISCNVARGETTSWIIHLVSDRLSTFCHLKGKLA